MYKNIIDFAKKNENYVANLLADLVSLPSLSGKEKHVVMRIKQEMEEIGFDEVRIDGIGNIIGRIGNGPQKIAFDAHIDVVDTGNPDLWDFEPFEGRVENGKVWGRGTADQKGGMASMLLAAKIIKEFQLEQKFTLYFTGTVMEEDCDGLCWNYLINEENIRPDFVVITEPTACNIYRGHRGRMEISVSVPGLSAHGSAPERGENAIYKMAKLVREIEQLNKNLKVDKFLGKGTVVVSEIKSVSPSLCAVPDLCSIYLDRRLTWGETKESAVNEILEIAKKVKLDIEVKIPNYKESGWTGNSYSMEKYYPTWKIDKNHNIVTKAINNYKNLFTQEPKVDKWTFSTNGVTICGVHGIPCIGFGPGFEEQAHAPNEFCPVDHLWKAASFYAGLLLD